MGPNGVMKHATVRVARRGDESAIAETQILAWAQTYEGILPDRLVTPWKQDDLAEIWRRRLDEPISRALTFVAEWPDGRICGFGICGKRRGQTLPTGGEVSLLYIRRSAQRRGTGRELMRAMAGTMLERGHRTTGVWVLADNHNAIAFYEKLGGILVADRTGQFGGHTTHELGFAWPTGLLARSGALKGVATR